jgi:hypothetical protein
MKKLEIRPDTATGDKMTAAPPPPQAVAIPTVDELLQQAITVRPELWPTTNPGEEFVDAPAVSARLGVSLGTVRNWRLNGTLPYIQTGGRAIRFFWPSVREAMLRRERRSKQ